MQLNLNCGLHFCRWYLFIQFDRVLFNFLFRFIRFWFGKIRVIIFLFFRLTIGRIQLNYLLFSRLLLQGIFYNRILLNQFCKGRLWFLNNFLYHLFSFFLFQLNFFNLLLNSTFINLKVRANLFSHKWIHIDDCGETHLYENFTHLQFGWEQYVQILIRINTDLIIVLIKIREGIIGRQVMIGLLYLSPQLWEGGMLKLNNLILAFVNKFDH